MFFFTAVSPNMSRTFNTPKPAHFQQVLQQFRAGAVQHVGCDLGEFGRIVGDQPVATAQQFQCEFALAGTCFAGNQHADGIDFHEHAVQRDPRCQRACQVVGQVVEQFVAALGRHPQGCFRFLCRIAQVFGAGLVLADHQRQRAVLHDLLDGFPALPRIQRIQPRQFFTAEDLHLVRVDGVEVAGQRRAAGDGVHRLEFARAAFLPGQPAQREFLLLLVEQFAGGDAGRHAAIFGRWVSSRRMARIALASTAQRKALRNSGREKRSASSDSTMQMLVGVMIGHGHRKHQIDGLAIGGIEIDRRLQPQQDATGRFQCRRSTVRYGDAMAYRRAAQLLARLQAGVNRLRSGLFASQPSGCGL